MSRDLRVEVAHGMGDVSAPAWDALVPADHPFLSHAFLHHLEDSGCVGPDAGQLPHHLLVWADGSEGARLVGAAPVYLKNHSYGEYIFDWSWADAAQRARLPYYPKVVACVPFTPATGPRMLVAADADRDAVFDALASGASALAEAAGASGVHWLFTLPEERAALAKRSFIARSSLQFVFNSEGWGSFEDFLGSLRSKRRKEVRRERRQAAELGLHLAVERVADLSGPDLDRLYRCYRRTIDEHGQIPYLTRAWWEGLGRALPDAALVATAREGSPAGPLVAGALAFHGGRHLYGRYWGALQDHPALHFELCYYRLVAWALDHGVTRVEAGAQGHHKLARGFRPAEMASAHLLRHPGLHTAVASFCAREAEGVRRDVVELDAQGPFHREEG